MIYTSNNNGKSFYEFKDAAYCSSCGEKVLTMFCFVRFRNVFSIVVRSLYNVRS